MPQLLNEPGRAQRARRRSSLVSSSRAVAHSCRRDQPARIQRIPVRRCRRPACAVADASETMPPKNPVPRVPRRQPLRPALRATSPYTGEAFGNDLSRQRFALPPTGGLPARSRGKMPTGRFSGRSNPLKGRASEYRFIRRDAIIDVRGSRRGGVALPAQSLSLYSEGRHIAAPIVYSFRTR